MKRLTDSDIQALYEEFDTPAHVKAHCRGVTDCALNLAEALIKSDPGNIYLDLSLIYGAGMVHDMARKQNPHEIVAADRLQQLGFLQESDIVREHMRTMTYHDINHVTEADLLYISDRLVLEDTFVGIEKRFAYLREKAIRNGRNPDSEMGRMNRRNSEDFVAAIEKKTGRSIFDICGNAN